MKVQIGYVDFEGTGFSAGNVYFNDFKHGESKTLVEMWLVDDEFVAVAENGQQVIINKSCARCWTTLHKIDWLKGEFNESPTEQEKLSRARIAGARAVKK